MKSHINTIWLRERQCYGEEDLRKRLADKPDSGKGKAKDSFAKLLHDGYIIPAKKAEEDEGFQCNFLGVIVVDGCVINCLPKYFKSDSPSTDEMVDYRQVLKVMDKLHADNTKPSPVEAFQDWGEEGQYNLLSVLLYLLEDYQENGLYRNEKVIIESNGSGEILWDKTVNETMAILSGERRRPCYIDLRTKRSIADDFDFFKRLHACVLDTALRQMRDFELLELFGLDGLELDFEIGVAEEDTEDELDKEDGLFAHMKEDFGEKEYILYRLEQELAVQFNTRKQHLLKAMHAYISEDKTLWEAGCFEVFGTSSYHVVWEKVCAEVLGNRLQAKVKDLPSGIMNAEIREHNSGDTLISLIEKPIWKGVFGEKSENKTTTLEPDIITVLEKDKLFLIFDAKYYSPSLQKNGFGLPGIGDITKQYLYHQAYHDKLVEGVKVANCLLLPWDGKTNVEEAKEIVDTGRCGSVAMKMFTDWKLAELQVRFLSAPKLYEYYLKGKRLTDEANFLDKMGIIINEL